MSSQRKLLRYNDLQGRGIAKSRAQLENMVKNYGFPAGFMVGPNSRAWFEDDVYAWLEALPSALEAKPPLRGAVRACTEAAKAGNPKAREVV